MLTLGLLGNALVALAYLSISGHVWTSVLRHEQRWRDNPLAVATALIFFSCAVGHGTHAAAYLGDHAAHEGFMTDPFVVGWDLLSAAVGIWYWSLRGLFPALRSTTSLYDDRQHRETEAVASALDCLPQALLLVDERFEVFYANEAASTRFGSSLGVPLVDAVPEELGRQLLGDYRSVLAEEAEQLSRLVEVGTAFYEVTCVSWRDGLLIGALDVSDKVAALREREHAERHLSEVLEMLPVGVAVTDDEGRIRSANAELSRMLDREELELVGHVMRDFVHPADAEESRDQLERMAAGLVDTVEQEKRLTRADGQDLWVRRRARLVRDHDGVARHVLASYVDVTDRRLYESQLEHLANHDALTALLNRRGFRSELDRHGTTVARYGARGGLIMLDLDNFKVVNDTLGHASGDQLILSVSGVLRDLVRDGDVVCRLGGDEFAVLVTEGDQADVTALAQRLVRGVREQAATFAPLRDYDVTISAGVAMFSDDVTADDVLSLADMALYDAKGDGKDRVANAQDEHHRQPKLASRLRWLSQIRTAVAEGTLTVFEQPIMDMLTGKVSMRELLVRLRLEDGSLALPAAWLYIAEQYDVMVDIDVFMLRRAVDILAADPDGPAVCVNVSGRSFSDPRTTVALKQALGAHPEVADRLVVEITETAAIGHVASAIAFATMIRDLGASVAIDDFGAGFGSFYYVKHLPFDILKIDGEFVSHCMSNSLDRHIVTAVARLATALGRQVIAEFVGDEATLDYLRRIGIRYAQGYHVGRPEPLEVGVPAQRTPSEAEGPRALVEPVRPDL